MKVSCGGVPGGIQSRMRLLWRFIRHSTDGARAHSPKELDVQGHASRAGDHIVTNLRPLRLLSTFSIFHTTLHSYNYSLPTCPVNRDACQDVDGALRAHRRGIRRAEPAAHRQAPPLGVDRDPITIRCGTGSNTEACPARYKCTAPPNCERYFQGVYYEGCIGTCVPDMPPI
ncbi:hypothetical protein CCM_08407 [Cordyceps militaris CM01]|uniref:Uncharacterized protein n=1 Tax=Cordyceps militaris (strain CM01) TaxID=983644 RepID=G3JR68_CORMM|nr:uncharacterized protein CCM_08407 [Cordyceps militaris CM01]EGX88364.1 hypothetical protein CCM_08407 [Cordyceps militaris CM01]